MEMWTVIARIGYSIEGMATSLDLSLAAVYNGDTKEMDDIPLVG